MTDPHAEIARAEREIEELSAIAERCRKVDLGARLAIAGGGLWLAAVLLGLAHGQSAETLLAIAAALGGIVLFGSNRSSWHQAKTRLDALQARRSELIDAMDMRVVREPSVVTPMRRLN